MGYCSDIRVILRKEDFERLKERMANFTYENPNHHCVLFNDDFINIIEENEDYIKFGWEYLKWYYPEYPEVKTIQDFITDECEEYFFLRVGEEIGDIEEHDCLEYSPNCLSASYVYQCIQD